MRNDQISLHNILYIQFALLCLIIPWSVAAMQIMLGIISLTFIIGSVLQKKNALQFHPIYLFMGIFLISLVCAALLSSDAATGLHNILHTNWIMLTVPIIVSLPLNDANRKQALQVLVFSATIAAFYAVFQFFTGMDLVGGRELWRLGAFHRASGAYSFYLTFAGNQLMIFGVAFVLFMQKKQWNRHKWLLFAAVIMIGLSMVATFGRSVWIGAIAILLLGTFLFYRNHFWKIMSILIVLGATIFITLPDIRERFLIIFDTSHQYNTGRINLWLTSWIMIKAYPWFGIGPGLFDTYFEQFKVPGVYDATGHAHNDYLHMAVQGGIITLLLWLSVWIVFFYYSLRFIGRNTSDNENSITVSAVVLAIAGIMIAAFFQCYFVDLENAILWWTLVAISIQVFIQEPARPAQTTE